MTPTRCFFVLLLALQMSCWTLTDKGLGKCREYSPYCVGDYQLVCEVDKRGCEVCTCTKPFPNN